MTTSAGDGGLGGREYCPGCEPGTDPFGEAVSVFWCAVHAPSHEGADDARVGPVRDPARGIGAEGLDNRRWCDLIHRGRRRP